MNKLETEIKVAKQKKYKRDLRDFKENRIYKWQTQKKTAKDNNKHGDSNTKAEHKKERVRVSFRKSKDFNNKPRSITKMSNIDILLSICVLLLA